MLSNLNHENCGNEERNFKLRKVIRVSLTYYNPTPTHLILHRRELYLLYTQFSSSLALDTFPSPASKLSASKLFSTLTFYMFFISVPSSYCTSHLLFFFSSSIYSTFFSLSRSSCACVSSYSSSISFPLSQVFIQFLNPVSVNFIIFLLSLI